MFSHCLSEKVREKAKNGKHSIIMDTFNCILKKNKKKLTLFVLKFLRSEYLSELLLT